MSANTTTAAPTGRKKLAQGKERSDAALGHDSQITSSPEGAKEGDGLPTGWRRVTLGEVTKSMKNGIYKPALAHADDGLTCLRMYYISAQYDSHAGDIFHICHEVFGAGKDFCKKIIYRATKWPRRPAADSGETSGGTPLPPFLKQNRRGIRVTPDKLQSVSCENSHANTRFVIMDAVGASEQTRIVAEVERRLTVVFELDSPVPASLPRRSIFPKAFSGNLL